MQIPSVWLLRMRFHIFLADICSQSWGRETAWGRFLISTTSRCWARPQPAAQRSPPGRFQPPSQAGYAPLKQAHKTSAYILTSISSMAAWSFASSKLGVWEEPRTASSERLFILRPVRVLTDSQSCLGRVYQHWALKWLWETSRCIKLDVTQIRDWDKMWQTNWKATLN